MTDVYDRISIELIDAGEHKDRVALVLSKVKGLTMTPQEIVNSAPCTVATDVPENIAEKLKDYLEKAGAMVMLEGGKAREEELLSSDELPEPEEAQEAPEVLTESAEISEPEEASEFEDALEFEVVQESEESLEFGQTEELIGPSEEELFGEAEEVTAPEFPEPPELSESEVEEREVPEEPKVGKFQQLLSGLPGIGRKQKQSREEPKVGKFQQLLSGLPGIGRKQKQSKAETFAETESEVETGGKKSPLAFLAKFRKSKQISEEESEEQRETPPEGVMEHADVAGGGRKIKAPDLMSNPVVLLIVGALAGAVIAGGLGMMVINSMKQDRQDYEIETARKIEEESAELKNLVQRWSQEAQTLREKNAALEQQSATLIAQLEEAREVKSIFPSQMPAEMVPWEEELVKSFQEVMTRHAQGLEKGTDAQKQAGCSQQLLLDGKSTYTYAHVVKIFNAKHTRYDIRRDDSIITPYVAEFKIPFQQEIKTGKDKKTCTDATLKQLETPEHHEFGGYYGYWTLEYWYKDGKWVLNQTVIERNRALYESAFQNGSPDYAKFRIDTDLFPELKPQ